ncbi:hypothetical protein [Methanocaldococcus sp.]
MMNNYNNILQIPGIKKVSFSYKRTQDFIFFLIVVAVPSSFFALVPSTVFYDIRLFFMLISSVYIFFYFKFLKKISNLPAGSFLIFLNIYLFIQIFYSIFIQDISFSEVATIFRIQFFYPISMLSFLLYISEMKNDRIYRFLYWVLLATLIQATLYIVSNLTGIDIFAIGSQAYDFKGATILQNMAAIPHYNEVLFAFAFTAVLTVKAFNKHWLWFIPLMLTIISIVRSQMLVYGMILFIILFLTKHSDIRVNFSKIFKIFLLILSFVVVLFILFPSHVNRLIDKFGIDKKETRLQKSYLEVGTFALRLRLIEEAYSRNKKNGNLLFGNGYERVAKKGEYDFVIGNDTLVAPILYTEGFIGLGLRILPIFILLIYFIRILLSSNRQYKVFSIITISLILPEFVNVIQTKLFVFYTREMFIFYILAMIIYNHKKYNKKEKNVT